MIQSDHFSDHATLAVLPVTGTLVAAPLLRINIEPSIENGLQRPSQIMVDKPLTLKRDKISPVFGRINRAQMTEVERCLAIFVGIAK